MTDDSAHPYRSAEGVYHHHGDVLDWDPETAEPVTYYAVVDIDVPPDRPLGIVRRIKADPPVDEGFTRADGWQPTEYLRRYFLGHDNFDNVEISEEQADTIIARWLEEQGSTQPEAEEGTRPKWFGGRAE